MKKFDLEENYLTREVFEVINEIIDVVNKNKDNIIIEYTKEGEILRKNLSLSSNNYKYWYDYDKIGREGVDIKAANFKVDNVTYRNIDSLYINGVEVLMGVREGFVSVEVDI